MDIYCPTCGEPWDNDSLHEEAEARVAQKADNESYGALYTKGTTYADVAAEFRKRGCKALVTGFGPQRSCTPTDPQTRSVIDAACELSGDDMDGAASDLDDFRSMGLLP